ncbi:hypothetical protein B0H14DRAFT_3128974 [Mycena olivaceomarginata]|nr:hypothetical protein B0H14DRAFT_3128974 [Mycena olivaceomarginata]
MLAEIPLDVTLEITRFLDLHDSFHLLTTCSYFEWLLSSKDFWLKTLDRIRIIHLQPLPCPVGTAIVDMPVDSLRRLAIHAYSLKKNWSVDGARPRSVLTISLGDDYNQICVIPGTKIVVTNSNYQLACWHAQFGVCLGAIEHEDRNASHQVGSAPPFHQFGQSYIALSSKSRTHVGLIVIKIDYRNEKAIYLSKTYSQTLPTEELQPILTPDATSDDETTGMVFTRHADQLGMLVYSNFNDGIVHRVPLGMRLGAVPACVLRNGHFYIHGQDLDGPSIVVRVPVDPSRRSDAEFDRIAMEIPSSVPAIHMKCIALGDPWLLPPTYGVALVTRRSSETRPSFRRPPLRIDSIQFWPASDEPSEGRLNFGDVVSYEHHQGIFGLCVGISGRYGVLLGGEPRRDSAFKAKHSLGLVHFAAKPHAPRTSFHALDVAGVPINYYTAIIAVDDALGAVYITHIGAGAAAKLSVLSYV